MTELEIRNILKPQKKIGDVFSDWIKLTWGFDKFYEKIILVAMSFWTVYSLYKIFWVGC